MKKKLKQYQINYLLEQVIAFTFISILAFIDGFVSYDLQVVKLSLKILTVVVIIIYEIIIHYIYKKAKQKQQENSEEIKKGKGYNEKYLWFNILLLVDILLLIALLSRIDIIIRLIVGFAIYYFISHMLRPYFGIEHHYNKDNNKNNKR